MYHHCQGESRAWWEVGTWVCCGARCLGMHRLYVRLRVLQFSYKLKDTKLRTFLLVTGLFLVERRQKQHVCAFVRVFPLYLRASFFLSGFWSRQERQGGHKDISILEREDGLLRWLQSTGWVLLGLNLPRIGVTLGSSTAGQMEKRKGPWREDHQGRGHPEYQKVLEPLVTGAVNRGDLSAFPASGSPGAGSHSKPRLCHLAGRFAKWGSDPVSWAELQILPVMLLHLGYDNPVQRSWSQPFFHAQQLVLPAVLLLNSFVWSSFHSELYCPRGQSILQQ